MTRSEPQRMVLAFDVLTPILLYLNRFMHLMFERNIFQGITSGQIKNLVVTCTGDCTCHHLKILEKV